MESLCKSCANKCKDNEMVVDACSEYVNKYSEYQHQYYLRVTAPKRGTIPKELMTKEMIEEKKRVQKEKCKEYDRKRYKEHREELIEKTKKYYNENKEEINKRQRERYHKLMSVEENRLKRNERKKKFYNTHKEEINQKNNYRYATDAEYRERRKESIKRCLERKKNEKVR